MRSLKEIFGEPARPPESFARAVGPVRRVTLAERIGPSRAPASTVPESSPPHHGLPQSAPPRHGMPQSAPSHHGLPQSAPPRNRRA